jgi:hypothetical protein|tara:strand:- start:36 stop:1082 length:1047 start_codon:yes stop_codon:yes gene_type:complete
MAYTTINKSSDYFNTKLYTGNSTDNHTISGVGFQPDFTWIKDRGRSGFNHRLQDSVRGATKSLFSNLTNAEQTNADAVKSFNSDGFVLGNDAGNGSFNGNSPFVSWNWKAGGSASSNSNGSITSSVSASTDAGFSIVSYTGNSTSGATVGHGLGVAPRVVLIKKTSGADAWTMLHVDSSGGLNTYLALNSSSGAISDPVFNNTAPTSTVFTLDSDGQVNDNGSSLIAYCFADVTGFSKHGSYVGNGSSNGPFIYTGFKPAFVMTKKTSGTSSWDMHDTKRDTFNVATKHLLAEDGGAEGSTVVLDILSNGFKFRTSNGDRNAPGETYIYMAFAEAPLVGSNNVPTTAR